MKLWRNPLAVLLAVLTPCFFTGQICSASEVGLRGNIFLLDGVPWRPKGIDTETFITCAQHTSGKYTDLRKYWGAAKLDKMRSIFHIDTVRLYVSQIGLDPAGGICGAEYREEIVEAVKLVLSKGLVAIIQMDWQTPTGEGKPLKELLGMPDERTVRAWRNLAPAFAHDRRVMYELFVEPKEHWSDGTIDKWSRGIQPVIDAVRGAGAENIILLDGLDYGRVTHGLAGKFHDPLPDRWAFVVDPQFTSAFKSRLDWDRAFGQVADAYPTLMAGYTYNNWSGCIEGADAEELVAGFFTYLKSKNIGIVLWGDYPETLWHGYDPGDLTSYRNFTGCQDHSYTGPRGGPGEMFARFDLR